MGIQHQNVVQSVGYCAESSWEAMKLHGSGNYIFAETPTRLLCFEYVCNESLDKYISGMIMKISNTSFFILSLKKCSLQVLR
jgi:hypothetical protein